MYSLESVQAVRELKASGMTTRAIAKSMKMSRTTVISLLKDRRVDVLVRREKNESPVKRKKDDLLAQEKYPLPLNPNCVETNGASKLIEFVRCPGCGAKVQKQASCLACGVRAISAVSLDCYLNELLTPSSCYPTKGMSHAS